MSGSFRMNPQKGWGKAPDRVPGTDSVGQAPGSILPRMRKPRSESQAIIAIPAMQKPQSDSIRSPRIKHLSWGRMEVERVGGGKDFKLWPGGGRAWDWRETGTRHVPGIQPEDIMELLEHGSKTVVLSRGMLLKSQTGHEALELLAERQVKVHVAETEAALDIDNGSAQRGEAVGGLLH